MKYTPQSIFNFNIELTLGEYTPQSIFEMVLDLGIVERVQLIAPANDATGVDPNVAFDWENFSNADFYRIKVYADDSGVQGEEVFSSVVSESELTQLLSENTNYWWDVRPTSPVAPSTITGTSITPSTATVVEGQTLVLNGSVQGTGDFNTSGTWTRQSGDMPYTVNGNEVTLAPTTSTQTGVFRFTAENGMFTERTVNAEPVSDFTPLNSEQGDRIFLLKMKELNPDSWQNEWSNAIIESGDWNSLHGVESQTINNEQRITSLNLISNGIGRVVDGENTGRLPQEWVNLKRCTYFNVKLNRFGGTVYNGLDGTEDFEWLLLGGSQLGDRLENDPPRGVYYHSGKGSGNSTNNFSGELPSTLNNLQNLEVIEITRQNFSGEFPDLSGCESLWGIFAEGNNFDGFLPIFADAMESIFMRSNNFSGGFPDEWGYYENLQFVDIGGNSQLEGEIPQSWGNLTLYSFNTSGAKLTKFPGQLLNYDGIHFFEPRVNSIDDTLPETVPHDYYHRLVIFVVQRGNLHGTIPHWVWYNTDQYIQFALDHNDLDGEIPDDAFAHWTRTRYMQVQSNRLSGSLPQLPSNTSFRIFRVDDNQFTGSIPEGHTQLPYTGSNPMNLRYDNNLLEGYVPPGILTDAQGRTIHRVQVNNNKFTFGDLYDVCNQAQITSHPDFRYGNQKNFGESEIRNNTLGTTQVIDFSDRTHEDDTYVWRKGSQEITSGGRYLIEGAKLTISDIEESDFANYRLEITNSNEVFSYGSNNLSGVTLISEPITIN